VSFEAHGTDLTCMLLNKKCTALYSASSHLLCGYHKVHSTLTALEPAQDLVQAT